MKKLIVIGIAFLALLVVSCSQPVATKVTPVDSTKVKVDTAKVVKADTTKVVK